MIRLGLSFAMVAGLATTALAQPGQAGGAPGVPPDAVPPVADPAVPPVGDPNIAPPIAPPTTVDPRQDPAWQLYHDAFEALAVEDRARATTLLEKLAHDYPSHPASALSLRTGLADTGEMIIPVEKPTKGAVAELALFQSLHGMFLGIETCVLVECDSGFAILGLALVGGAVGAALPFQIGPVRGGTKSLINSGTFWGAANAGLGIAIAADNSDNYKAAIAALMAGSIGGAGIGYAIDQQRPTAGQVAIANSGGLWAGVLTMLTMATFEDHIADDKTYAIGAMVAIDAGLVGGAYLAHLRPDTSRAQSFVIDASGLAGGVGGGALGILIGGETTGRANIAMAAGGVVVGLGVAGYLTRNWGDRVHRSGATADGPTASIFVAPSSENRGTVAGFAGSF